MSSSNDVSASHDKPNPFLLAMDFDHTILDLNSDIVAADWVEDADVLEDADATYAEDKDWIAYMNNINKALHKQGLTPEQYRAQMVQCKLVDGMAAFMEWAVCKAGMEIVILSDANELYIQWILEHNCLSHLVSKVFTNKASFSVDGCLQVTPFSVANSAPHSCSRCSYNLCKGKVLTDIISTSQNTFRFPWVTFVGDGHNDFCPGTHLRHSDLLAVRVGFTLHQMLLSNSGQKAALLKCRYITWSTGEELQTAMERVLEEKEF